MKKLLLTLTAVASLTIASNAGNITFVDAIDKADADHAFPNPGHGSTATFAEDPASYSQGWRDGWNWCSHNPKFNNPYNAFDCLSDSQDQETILYGDTTKDPATDKSLAFDDAVEVYRDAHHLDVNGRTVFPNK